ncbi:MAG TPA: CvpA family protein [Candidatus Limnocylindria bacterium]|nr:CvpA family protein [Candidatus Limnocylindria bacterium]
MEQITQFDLVILLALIAMFIVGYAQGVIRRLLGIAAILFSLFLAAQLRQPLGEYLSREWTQIAPAYSLMVAFGAVFVAAAVTLSIGIQITYRPAPLFPKYPVLDELLGGLLGVLEGFIILVALLLILDPYYNLPEVRETVGVGEFRLLRTLHDFLDPTLAAAILRDNVIPALFAVLGVLFPQDVRDAFKR